jgi:hypothetical protein
MGIASNILAGPVPWYYKPFIRHKFAFRGQLAIASPCWLEFNELSEWAGGREMTYDSDGSRGRYFGQSH